MKIEIKVSVIIPCYNAANYLPEAIESVLAQTYHDYEIIVVDDGSTDQTSDIITQYQSRLNYIYQKNMGVGAARNTGIRYAKGEYLVFLDADDILLKNKLQIQASYLDQNPNISVVTSPLYCFYEKDNGEEEIWKYTVSERIKRSLGEPFHNIRIFSIQNIFPPIANMVRVDCVREIGGFDISRELMPLADWDLWFRLGVVYNFAYLDEFVAKYRILQNSMSRYCLGMRKASENFEKKIEDSIDFNLLSKTSKSDFYFYWGVTWLDFGESGLALDRFRNAIQYYPNNILARSAYLLTRLMGEKAVIFFHLKRKIVGV